MSAIHAAPAADLELLRKYDTPTICNVVELFDIVPRTSFYMDGRIRACYPKLPPMVGYASTATFRSAGAPHGGNVYAGLGDQVAAFEKVPGPPIVVFQDLDSPVVAATFGEVMCTTYKTFGAAGLITSGAARDLDQVEALNFPCFSDGVICAHGYCQILQVHGPVHVGGLTVHPGDLLHGDCNGVTSIPNHLASAVANACPELATAESIVLDYLKAGHANLQGFNDARKASKAKIDELARSLRAEVIPAR
ncbi:MAG: RraA family protein [Gemmataceae bacterium]|nr:RraA family protein [Gemmataceae bacterium]